VTQLAAGAPARSPSSLLAAVSRRTGLTPVGLLAALAVVGCGVVGRAFANRAVFLLLYGGVAVLGLAWLLARRRLAVSAERSALPSRVAEGRTVEVELTLRARSRISTIVLEERLASGLGPPVRVPVPLLAAGAAVSRTYNFAPRLRGVYQIGPLTAEWSDPFGLIKRRVQLAPAVRLLVHPATERVTDRIASREWEDPPVRPPVSKPWPTGFEFYGMRDYVPGDDPRRIVWRATARSLDLETGTGRYLVREAEQGITDRVMLLLDTDAASHSPGTPSDTFERAVKAVASLGAHHLNDGFSVSLADNTGRLAARLRGRPARIPLLDALAAVRPSKAPLREALDRVLTDASRGASHQVVVTPHLDHEATRRLRLLVNAGASLLVVLVQWDESDPNSTHRAAGLGCNVVELQPGVSLDRVFRHVVATRQS
jgi:uncharacterized protein (DUF58 family)